MPPERPRLLSIAAAADRLGISPSTLRRWADAGRVKSVRLLSGYRRFDVDEIDRVRREMGLDTTEATM